jgi:hypothetical protein
MRSVINVTLALALSAGPAIALDRNMLDFSHRPTRNVDVGKRSRTGFPQVHNTDRIVLCTDESEVDQAEEAFRMNHPNELAALPSCTILLDTTTLSLIGINEQRHMVLRDDLPGSQFGGPVLLYRALWGTSEIDPYLAIVR